MTKYEKMLEANKMRMMDALEWLESDPETAIPLLKKKAAEKGVDSIYALFPGTRPGESLPTQKIDENWWETVPRQRYNFLRGLGRDFGLPVPEYWKEAPKSSILGKSPSLEDVSKHLSPAILKELGRGSDGPIPKITREADDYKKSESAEPDYRSDEEKISDEVDDFVDDLYEEQDKLDQSDAELDSMIPDAPAQEKSLDNPAPGQPGQPGQPNAQAPAAPKDDSMAPGNDKSQRARNLRNYTGNMDDLVTSGTRKIPNRTKGIIDAEATRLELEALKDLRRQEREKESAANRDETLRGSSAQNHKRLYDHFRGEGAYDKLTPQQKADSFRNYMTMPKDDPRWQGKTLDQPSGEAGGEDIIIGSSGDDIIFGGEPGPVGEKGPMGEPGMPAPAPQNNLPVSGAGAGALAGLADPSKRPLAPSSDFAGAPPAPAPGVSKEEAEAAGDPFLGMDVEPPQTSPVTPLSFGPDSTARTPEEERDFQEFVDMHDPFYRMDVEPPQTSPVTPLSFGPDSTARTPQEEKDFQEFVSMSDPGKVSAHIIRQGIPQGKYKGFEEPNIDNIRHDPLDYQKTTDRGWWDRKNAEGRMIPDDPSKREEKDRNDVSLARPVQSPYHAGDVAMSKNAQRNQEAYRRGASFVDPATSTFNSTAQQGSAGKYSIRGPGGHLTDKIPVFGKNGVVGYRTKGLMRDEVAKQGMFTNPIVRGNQAEDERLKRKYGLV